MPHALRRFGAAVATLLFAAAAAGQQPAPAPAPPPVGPGVRAAVDVTAMDLDVVATAKGAPVTDLRKDEVTVTVDGKAYAPDYFARIEAGQVHGPDLATASPDLVLDATRAGADRWVPRQFLAFFDD